MLNVDKVLSLKLPDDCYSSYTIDQTKIINLSPSLIYGPEGNVC